MMLDMPYSKLLKFALAQCPAIFALICTQVHLIIAMRTYTAVKSEISICPYLDGFNVNAQAPCVQSKGCSNKDHPNKVHSKLSDCHVV